MIKEGVNGFSFDPLDKEELFSLMKEIVDGKHNLKKMGEASLVIIQDYTPKRAAKVIVETVKSILEKND